jgi:hypothetical protein
MAGECAVPLTNDDSFSAGYWAGWAAVKGNSRENPIIPSQPAIPAGRTPFQIGLRMGAWRASKTDTA